MECKHLEDFLRKESKFVDKNLSIIENSPKKEMIFERGHFFYRNESMIRDYYCPNCPWKKECKDYSRE